MSRSIGLAHVIRKEDGTCEGVWGVHALKSAFQPIFAFDGEGRLSPAGFEGLLRAFRDGEEEPTPRFFAAVAPADRFHVETLARTLHLINAGACLDPALPVFINFDPSLLSDREVVDLVLRDMRLVLHEAGIEPGRVMCELTENRAGAADTLVELAAAMRAHGLGVAIDDYGAEDSDMERVVALKPDIVKFDGLWVTRLMASRPGRSLLAVMVDRFEERGIATVFEGIEEGWQLDAALEAGVSMVQGYALARPELAPTRFSAFGQAGRVGTMDLVAAPEQAPTRPATTAPSVTRRAATFGRRGGG